MRGDKGPAVTLNSWGVQVAEAPQKNPPGRAAVRRPISVTPGSQSVTSLTLGRLGSVQLRLERHDIAPAGARRLPILVQLKVKVGSLSRVLGHRSRCQRGTQRTQRKVMPSQMEEADCGPPSEYSDCERGDGAMYSTAAS